MSKTPYTIGIVGYGVVGQGIHRLFKNWVKAIYDPGLALAPGGVGAKAYDHAKENGLPVYWGGDSTFTQKSGFADLDLIIICVPTNEKDNGDADVSIVLDSIRWIREVAPNTTIMIKSTTPPTVLKKIYAKEKDQFGFCPVVFSPEYMGESSYFTPFWKYPDPVDMEKHDFQIFGGDEDHTSLCVDIFIRRMGPTVRFHQTDIVSAALVKYMENCFFATKVTFCNEFYDIAEALGVDYNEVRELWLLDSRVGPMHTAVFPDKRGYGGKCFPKDLRAMRFEAKNRLGYHPTLLEGVDTANERMKTNQ